MRGFIGAAVSAAALLCGSAVAQPATQTETPEQRHARHMGQTPAAAPAPAARPASPDAAPAPGAPAAAARPQRPPGYLAGVTDFNPIEVVPPFPARGSPAEAADIAAYRATLAQRDTPRWAQAIADDPVSLREGLGIFRCAVGLQLNSENAPTLMRLLLRTQMDVGGMVDRAKRYFRRPRPFADEPTAPICLNVPAEMRGRVSSAYPSGHSTLGMAWGLILAELAPERATQIMTRVRDYSESRLVCRIHFPSDLEAGHMLGAAAVARMHAVPEFRTDMEAARAEVAAARRAQTSAPQGCPAPPPPAVEETSPIAPPPAR